MEQGKLLLMQMTPFLLNSPSPLFHEIPGLPVQHWDVPAAVWGWHVLLCSMSSFVFVFPSFCFLGFFVFCPQLNPKKIQMGDAASQLPGNSAFLWLGNCSWPLQAALPLHEDVFTSVLLLLSPLKSHSPTYIVNRGSE